MTNKAVSSSDNVVNVAPSKSTEGSFKREPTGFLGALKKVRNSTTEFFQHLNLRKIVQSLHEFFKGCFTPDDSLLEDHPSAWHDASGDDEGINVNNAKDVSSPKNSQPSAEATANTRQSGVYTNVVTPDTDISASKNLAENRLNEATYVPASKPGNDSPT